MVKTWTLLNTLRTRPNLLLTPSTRQSPGCIFNDPITIEREDGEEEQERSCTVVVPDDQLSLAIGKRGQNARLAARLTKYKIDIKSASEMEEIQAQEADDDETPATDDATTVDNDQPTDED